MNKGVTYFRSQRFPAETVGTCNGAESCHGHLNDDFSAPHPNIYIFVETLLRQQAATYVNVGAFYTKR